MAWTSFAHTCVVSAPPPPPLRPVRRSMEPILAWAPSQSQCSIRYYSFRAGSLVCEGTVGRDLGSLGDGEVFGYGCVRDLEERWLGVGRGAADAAG